MHQSPVAVLATRQVSSPPTTHPTSKTLENRTGRRVGAEHGKQRDSAGFKPEAVGLIVTRLFR